jgi:hypothetical protein
MRQKAARYFCGTGDHTLAANTISWLYVVAKHEAYTGQPAEGMTERPFD